MVSHGATPLFPLPPPFYSTTSVHHVAASLFPRGGASLFASKAPVSSDDVSLLPFPPPPPPSNNDGLHSSLGRCVARVSFSLSRVCSSTTRFANLLRPFLSVRFSFRSIEIPSLPRGWFILWREEKGKLESRPLHRWSVNESTCWNCVSSSLVWKKWRLGMFLVRRWWFIEGNALISFLPRTKFSRERKF